MSRREVKRNLARRLRRQSTTAEQHVWNILRNRRMHGFKFRRQHVNRGFVVDFYCHELQLVLEVDGRHHLNPASAAYDKMRSRILESVGLHVIRIPNEKATREYLADLIGRRKNLLSSPPSPASGRAR